jgi:hypothetical protein
MSMSLYNTHGYRRPFHQLLAIYVNMSNIKRQPNACLLSSLFGVILGPRDMPTPTADEVESLSFLLTKYEKYGQVRTMLVSAVRCWDWKKTASFSPHSVQCLAMRGN